MQFKTCVHVALFIFLTLLLTRLDYLVNSEFYSFGLQFSDEWYQIYTNLYMAVWLVSLICLYFVDGNWKLTLVEAAFVYSSGVDLVYFAVWNRGVFPEGNWTWMSYYKVFGAWTTVHQAAFTAICVGLAAAFATLASRGGRAAP